jgi:hypothetical protein
MKCDSQASFLARTFTSLCLGHKSKVKVATMHAPPMMMCIKMQYVSGFKKIFPFFIELFEVQKLFKTKCD